MGKGKGEGKGTVKGGGAGHVAALHQIVTGKRVSADRLAQLVAAGLCWPAGNLTFKGWAEYRKVHPRPAVKK